MKTIYYYLTLFIVIGGLLLGCSSGDDTDQMLDDDIIQTDDPNTPNDPEEPNDPFEMVDVQVMLPEGSSLDISTTTILSLGSTSAPAASGQGEIPFNPGTVELAYLLDAEDNVLLAGFVSDNRKELSIATTVEVMLYFGLDYYLLADDAKQAFLNAVGQIPNYNNLISDVEALFVDNPLMYSEGTYLNILNQVIDEVSTGKKSNRLEKRIFLDDVLQKSGITFSQIDESSINLQNSLPRRSRILVYKKSFYDRDVNLTEIPNYRESEPLVNLEFEPSGNAIGEFQVGNSLSVINANAAAIENITESGPINLPTNPPSEFAVEYEVVVIGSGKTLGVERDFTNREREIYGDINVETYILDYFLPTLLDIGGNKALLQGLNENRQQAILDAVATILAQYPSVLEDVRNNEFKDASEAWFPQLYDNIRLSDDLRSLLGNIYNILSTNGNAPNTFIQSQELAETGLSRTERIIEVIYQNIDLKRKTNSGQLRTDSRTLEQWQPFSIDADVAIIAADTEVCLGTATALTASLFTLGDPAVETFEFHWTSSDNFGGRIQDINGNPNNFGTSIVTEERSVSYISTALESELGNGANIETITLTVMARNINRNDLTEVGSATIEINNLRPCESFTASFERQPNLRETTERSCPNEIGYQAFSPVLYAADFEAVEGATGYLGVITRSNGVVNDEIPLDDELLEDLGDGRLRYTTGVGSVIIFNSCSEAQAQARAEELVNNITVEPVSIEITPVF